MGKGYTMQEAMDEVKWWWKAFILRRAAKSLAENIRWKCRSIEESETSAFEDKPAADAVRDLMLRDKKVETPMLPWQ